MRSATFMPLGLCLCLGLICTPSQVDAEQLSFPRAVKLAEDRGEILMLRASAVKRAGLELAEARSRLGPQLTFEAAGGCTAFPQEGITVEAGELGTIPPPISYSIPPDDLVFVEAARHGYFELSLRLVQPLYTWGKLDSSVRLAGLGVQSSRADLAEAERQMQLDLHRAYFSAVLAEDSLGLLRQILDILRAIEEDRRRALELGTENRLAVLQVQAQIAELKRRIVQAEQAHSSAREAVALYTDLDAESLELSSEFRNEHPGLDEQQLKASALKVSAVLRKARLEEEQARANLERIRGGANLRPDISFNLSVELSGQTVPWSESGWEDYWDLNLIAGLGTKGSLFDSGRSRHQLHQAEEALSARRLATDLLRKQLRLQTRRAVETVQLRWAELEEAIAALSQAEEEEKNASRAFRQELLIREQWGFARIAAKQKRLFLLEREYSFELALYELESLAGFP